MNPTIQTLSYPESEKLLIALLVRHDTEAKMRNGVRNYCIALLMLDAGLRVGEVVKLTVQQLYYAGYPVGGLSLVCEKKKVQTERTIPLTIRLSTAIEEMSRVWWIDNSTRKHFHAFYKRDTGRHITTRQVERIINAAAHKALNRSIHPHVLRHTFATRLMTKCPIRVVQQLLGHADIGSTQIYQHPNSEHLQQAINTLNKAGGDPVNNSVDNV